MSTGGDVPSDCEVRAVIKFLSKEGIGGAEIHSRLCAVYGKNNVMQLRNVYRWVQMFTAGRTSTHDNARDGRPSTAVNDETVNIVRALLAEDRRYTITDMHHKIATEYPFVSCSRFSIHGILTELLEMTKVCARWVPRQLTSDHKKNRMGAALQLLTLYNEEGEAFFDRVVTGDETWVHYWTPETKEASKQWKTRDEPTPVKFKEQPSAGKVMATVFWDRQGVLLVEYLADRSTLTQDTYFDTLMKLRDAIKRKRPGKLSKGILLLHDNARPHVAKLIRHLLDQFRWKVFGHPPYSPDLAPSDYHLFPDLKKALGGKHFSTSEEVKKFVADYFQKKDVALYAAGIEKLLYRYSKCLDREGDYVEK